jgi:hypothetical protein
MKEDDGVIVGCDVKAEWLLPWWWRHYRAHSSYPVAFIDFGMSKKAQKFCEERGRVVTLQLEKPLLVAETAPEEGVYDLMFEPGFREIRYAWLKKPLACLQSPFERTVWIDLDCRVEGKIDPIFEKLGVVADIALVRDRPFMQEVYKKTKTILEGEVMYNSGVVGFVKGSTTIRDWADIILEGKHTFPGDQDALSRVIFTQKRAVIELPLLYNWCWADPPVPGIVITHFMGAGKKWLKKQAS